MKADLERADERLRRFAVRGTFLRVDLDHDRWLTWGAAGELPVLMRSSFALVAAPPVQVAARFADLERLHLGGLLWPETAGRLAHTAYVTREEIRGMATAEARMLLLDLLEHATQQEFVYRHVWQNNDVVMWDNRCTLHRGRSYDLSKMRELRRCTTELVAA